MLIIGIEFVDWGAAADIRLEGREVNDVRGAKEEACALRFGDGTGIEIPFIKSWSPRALRIVSPDGSSFSSSLFLRDPSPRTPSASYCWVTGSVIEE